MTQHDCKQCLQEAEATVEHPYRYVDSGLSNVYLVGIKYWTCGRCKAHAAEIPAVEQLMDVIAECIVMKPGLLEGQEIRFLRKKVGKKSADFAALLDYGPEHYSKLENDQLPLTEGADKQIRLTFGILCGNRALREKIAQKAEAWLKSIHGKNKEKIRVKKISDHRWSAMAKAA